MDETKFPTQQQVETRAERIIEGFGDPGLVWFPGLVFRRLTLAEKGQAARVYAAFLKEEMTAGGRFSEPLLHTELRRRCLEVGVNYDQLMAQEEEFQKRIYDQAPANLRDAGLTLSSEEMLALDPEAKVQYLAVLKDRGSRIREFLQSLFTPEEHLVRSQIEQVKVLKNDLQALTYEHVARVRKTLVEILHGARRADELQRPYFNSLEELYDLEDTNPDAFLALAAKWREYRAGKWPGFTQQSSSTPPSGNG